jgi:hypothetical protein
MVGALRRVRVYRERRRERRANGAERGQRVAEETAERFHLRQRDSIIEPDGRVRPMTDEGAAGRG